MLIFIDESGDTGRKLNRGSSRYFIVSMALFSDLDEAERCDKRIELLKGEIGKLPSFEFHFSHNSDKVRMNFLKAIHPYKFVYFSVVIDKNPKKLWGPGFNNKESFYKYACQMAMTNALPFFDSATVILDKSGSPDFRSRLAKYLRSKIKDKEGKSIKKLKQQRSSSNNLLQLADYITGIVNRKIQNKKDWQKTFQNS